jgi:DNA-binding Xre family transcriptional regulator
MKEKQVSQYKLLKSGIDNKTLDALKKSKNITLLTLEKLCSIWTVPLMILLSLLIFKNQHPLNNNSGC